MPVPVPPLQLRTRGAVTRHSRHVHALRMCVSSVSSQQAQQSWGKQEAHHARYLNRPGHEVAAMLPLQGLHVPPQVAVAAVVAVP